MKIFEQLKDKTIIFKVNDLFYDKVYKHPWLCLFFKDIEQDFITKQQTDFMVGAFGGPKEFGGRLPSNAHPHMYITDELFDIREQLLKEAMLELSAPELLIESWLKIDEAFRGVIVKPMDCLKKRYNSDDFLIFENPEKLKKVA